MFPDERVFLLSAQASHRWRRAPLSIRFCRQVLVAQLHGDLGPLQHQGMTTFAQLASVSRPECMAGKAAVSAGPRMR